MPSLRESVSRALRGVPPLHRVVATAAHPTRQGARLTAVGRAVRYEVLTRGLGRPMTVPLGDRSRLIAYKGETNVHNAVIANPPNFPDMLVWKNRLGPGDLFVDIGANIGAYTIWACELGARVVAVEPNAHNAGRIREHLALNGYEAEVVEKALSDSAGVVRMTTELDSFNHLVDEGGVEVAATTLDDLLGDRTACVKIDVEGAESLVLAGARRALSERRIPVMQLEWAVNDHMVASDRTSMTSLLEDAGYELCLPDRCGRLTPVGDREPRSINVFALPRS